MAATLSANSWLFLANAKIKLPVWQILMLSLVILQRNTSPRLDEVGGGSGSGGVGCDDVVDVDDDEAAAAAVAVVVAADGTALPVNEMISELDKWI